METTLTATPYSQKHQLDLNPTAHIETSTLEYLHVVFLLWEYKCVYSKREYRTLLDTYGWDKGTAEERRALKIAENFQEFATCPQHLAPIPVTILLKLCSKKYQPIINQLQDYPIGGLTCEVVLELIEERKALLKAEKETSQNSFEEKPSIWRRTPRGERFVQFPPLWEENHQTGVLAQELIDEYGLLPQAILREAIADYHAKLTQEKEQSQETAESEMVVVDSEIPPQVEISPIDSEETKKEVISSVEQNEQAITLQVREFATDGNRQDGNSPTSSATEQQPVEVEEAFILAEKLRSVDSYYQIRCSLYRHFNVKDQAWELLSPEEKSRIEKLLPQEVLALNEARNSGLIVDFYELETGWFQIFIHGVDTPIIVSKSNVFDWLKEQESITSVIV
ncbi:hypothetical protein PI95_004345 [Hassallia byssoidea VB512170]|uniref:Uncharacterized protein n=1 Tax=Hassallia byssoidea VB512170 TaxID=1304833 RepID=A0A846H3M9_9CYAN|nr:hypothetical protein [Hassalia byssoidea]NEU71825.1 hypothetical protein [Hassalia byssoidea VB512170]